MEEETKAEEVKGKETNNLDKLVDEVLLEKPEKENPEKSDGVQKEDSESKGNGWITMLPKELRDGIDTEKFSSLSEYVKALQSNQKEEPVVVTKEEVEKSWTELVEEQQKSATSENEKESIKALVESFKTQGLDAKTSKETIKTLKKYGEETLKKMQDAQAKNLEDYVSKNWGENADKNFESAKQGLKVIALENRDMLISAKQSGLTNNPAFIEVCRMLGERSSESHISNGSKGTSSDFDPRNPLKFK